MTRDPSRRRRRHAHRDRHGTGSTITARKNLALNAGRDFNVSSASDSHNVETRSKHNKTRTVEENGQTTQLASELTAGNNFTAQAGCDSPTKTSASIWTAAL
ncbi:hemagglutinin repeat-containing protein [Pseudomonas syringae]|uniref:hemagglutinin repeat-containing protein n=1 Tax=Pseudomonas syringae TaxID=317 RepID=UPI003D2F611D